METIEVSYLHFYFRIARSVVGFFESNPQLDSAPYCIRTLLSSTFIQPILPMWGPHRSGSGPDPADPIRRRDSRQTGARCTLRNYSVGGIACNTFSEASRMAGLSSPVETVCRTSRTLLSACTGSSICNA